MHKDVINEEYDKRIEVVSKHPIHEVHKCCWGISQPKGHLPKLIVTISCLKGRYGNIFISPPNLVISQPQGNFGKVAFPLELEEDTYS